MGIFDINDSLGTKVAEELVTRGLSVSFQKVDVSNQEDCVQSVQHLLESSSSTGLHYLVNCAACFVYKGPCNVEPKDWEKSLGVNVVGYSNMVQACYPYMSKLPGDKSIVNVSSGAGHRVEAGFMTYCTSKGAILTMTKCMALDLSKDKIRVNSVSPAFVWTPALRNSNPNITSREEWDKALGSCLIIRRLTNTTEQASAICFLLSEDASCITATDLPVDGGYLALSPEGHGN